MMGVEHTAVLSGSEFSPSPHHDQGHLHLMEEHSFYLMTRVVPLPMGTLLMTRVVPLPRGEHY